MLGNVEALLAVVKFDGNGLVPVIAQDREQATFWSRSRRELWEKGATSGNSMKVQDVRIDCDGDAILYLVDARGPSCHTNATSCFFRTVTPAGLAEDDGPAACNQA